MRGRVGACRKAQEGVCAYQTAKTCPIRHVFAVGDEGDMTEHKDAPTRACSDV